MPIPKAEVNHLEEQGGNKAEHDHQQVSSVLFRLHPQGGPNPYSEHKPKKQNKGDKP